jgi:hypothetical protein
MRLHPDYPPVPANYAWLLATCEDQELRDYQVAIEQAQRACQLSREPEPNFLRTLAQTYLSFADDLAERGQNTLANENYNHAADVLFDLAEVLATHQNNALRRPDEAIRVAEKACRLSEHPDYRQMGMLADIYAKTGHLAQACRAVEEAIGQALEAGETKRADELRSRLKRYQTATSRNSQTN